MPPETSPHTVLAFDTAAAHCAVALLCGDRFFGRTDEMARGQAEHLMPMLAEILGQAGIGWRDLDGIGVGIGPGNFTGIRIGVAAARGLGLGLGVPVVGLSGFDTADRMSVGIAGSPLSPGDLEALPQDGARGRLICLRAPRGMAYVQREDADGTRHPPRLADPASEAPFGLLPEEIGRAACGPVAGLFVGSPHFARRRINLAEVRARPARLARERIARGETGRPAPLYIRSADAAPPRDPAPVLLP